MKQIVIRKMTPEAFAPFGELIDFDRDPDFAINKGMCDRYNALAGTNIDGDCAISLGRAKPYSLPLKLEMVERHPLGSQAFIPLEDTPFLVVVAPDTNDGPGEPIAFMTSSGQGVSYFRNTWHGVLTPLNRQMDFIIVDRDGSSDETPVNLEEWYFETPYEVVEAV